MEHSKSLLDVLQSRKTVALLEEDNDNSFTVSTYNMLADFHLLHAALFEFYYCYYDSWTSSDYCTRSHEEKLKRKEKNLDEILFHSSDIVCLQEVDVWFYSVIIKAMAARGYESVFLRKTFSTGEGLVISVKKDKFNIRKSHYVRWSDLLKAKIAEKGLDFDKIHHIDIDSVAIVLELQCKLNQERLLICDFHAVYEYDAPEVSALQISLLSQRIKEIQEQVHSKYGMEKDCPVLFVGDFNNEPTFYGYKLMTTGTLSSSDIDALKHLAYDISDEASYPIEKSKEEVACTNFKDCFYVPLKFYSAYKEAKGSEPAVTCVDKQLLICLDYIFYTNGLQLISVLDVPDVRHLINTGDVCLLPSDHISLKATFSFSNLKNKDKRAQRESSRL